MIHPPRIGIDAHMVGGRETGNETYVRGLVGGLGQIDAELEIFVYGGGSLEANGPITRRSLLSSSPLTRLTFDLPLRAAMDRLDVLHCTYTAPVFTTCAVVLTVHDISYESHPEWFSARDVRVLKRFVPWSIGRAAKVITVSEVCRQEIIETYHVPEDKVICVHNAAGPAAMPLTSADAEREVAKLGLNRSRPTVLAVGNLQPRKNLVRLIGAFARLLADGVDADLVLVGPEHYRAELVHQAAESAAGHIRFTGYLSDRQLAACYTTATVFAFPSLYEGFGIPALEAMAHGAPVVCSDISALREVCGEAALYFDPLDETDIASQLKQVLTQPDLRRRLSSAGLERQGLFSWATAARQTMTVYLGAIQRARNEPTTD